MATRDEQRFERVLARQLNVGSAATVTLPGQRVRRLIHDVTEIDIVYSAILACVRDDAQQRDTQEPPDIRGRADQVVQHLHEERHRQPEDQAEHGPAGNPQEYAAREHHLQRFRRGAQELHLGRVRIRDYDSQFLDLCLDLVERLRPFVADLHLLAVFGASVIQSLLLSLCLLAHAIQFSQASFEDAETVACVLEVRLADLLADLRASLVASRLELLDLLLGLTHAAMALAEPREPAGQLSLQQDDLLRQCQRHRVLLDQVGYLFGDRSLGESFEVLNVRLDLPDGQIEFVLLQFQVVQPDCNGVLEVASGGGDFEIGDPGVFTHFLEDSVAGGNILLDLALTVGQFHELVGDILPLGVAVLFDEEIRHFVHDQRRFRRPAAGH